jgi:hypothetical protein
MTIFPRRSINKLIGNSLTPQSATTWPLTEYHPWGRVSLIGISTAYKLDVHRRGPFNDYSVRLSEVRPEDSCPGRGGRPERQMPGLRERRHGSVCGGCAARRRASRIFLSSCESCKTSPGQAAKSPQVVDSPPDAQAATPVAAGKREKSNNWARASCAMAVLSLLISWIPPINIVAIGCVSIALLLTIFAFVLSFRRRGNGRVL